MTHARDAPPPGWLAITDLARARGVDKSAISRRVSRLAEAGLLSTRIVGKTKLVNVEEFDRVTASTVDGMRELNGLGAARITGHSLAAPAAPPPVEAATTGLPILAHEQARRVSFDADLKRLELETRTGKLVEIDAVRLNLSSCAIELGRVLDALPSRADALAAVVAKDGVTGLRAALRAIAREWREMLARAAERFAEGDELSELDENGVAEEAAA